MKKAVITLILISIPCWASADIFQDKFKKCMDGCSVGDQLTQINSCYCECMEQDKLWRDVFPIILDWMKKLNDEEKPWSSPNMSDTQLS